MAAVGLSSPYTIGIKILLIIIFRCDHCNCLVPAMILVEHQRECWQKVESRQRVLTAAEKRRKRN